jgi:2'-5' RNA ligase
MRLFFALWPPPETARALGEWAGPRETPPTLSELVKQLDASLMEQGFLLEKRPFAAHVTLLRKASKSELFPELPSVAWPVGEFALVRSSLSPQGSRYEVVERFALQG